MSKPTALGVYIFAGGFTVGVKQAGFKVLAHFEGNAYGVGAAKKNFSRLPIHVGPENWPIKEYAGRVDFLYANPPCAVFSAIGIRTTRGMDAWKTDPRTHCWIQTFNLLESIRPRVLAIESVPQAFTTGRELMDTLANRALVLGYSVTFLRTDAKWTGIPQSRKRFFFIAHKTGSLAGFGPGFSEPPTVGAVLRMINDPGESMPVIPRHKKLVAKLKPGEKLVQVWERYNPESKRKLNAHGKVVGRPSFQDTRLDADKCMGAFVGDKYIHPTEDRRIGIQEAKALCGYPPMFEVEGTRSGWASMLARAVLPPVGAALGRAVKRALKTKPGKKRVELVDWRKPGIETEDLTHEYLHGGRGDNPLPVVGEDVVSSKVKRKPRTIKAPGKRSRKSSEIRKAVQRGTVRGTVATQADDSPPTPGEGSGHYIQRVWLTGKHSPDDIVDMVHEHYQGRTTARSDVYFNYRQVLDAGVSNVPPWPARRKLKVEPEVRAHARRGGVKKKVRDVAKKKSPRARVVKKTLGRPGSRTAIVDWHPRICGSTDWGSHLSAAGDAELVSFSKSGKALKSWTHHKKWKPYKIADAPSVLADYDEVILNDLVCFSPNVTKINDEPYYLDVLEKYQGRWVTMYHGGTYPTKYDDYLDRVFQSPGFTGTVFTTRVKKARERLSERWPEVKFSKYPHLPYDPARAAPIPKRRRKQFIMTARLASNKGQNAALIMLPELSTDVIVYGYNSFGLPSIGWRLWELGQGLGYSNEGKPKLRRGSESLKHPRAHRFYTGRFTHMVNSNRFEYRDGYDHLTEIDWSPMVHLSLPTPDFGGTLEYVTLDAIYSGCVAVVPEAGVDEVDYESIITVPFDGCTLWYNIDKREVRGRDFDRANCVRVLNDVMAKPLSQLEAVAKAQRAEMIEKHDPKEVMKRVRRTLKK